MVKSALVILKSAPKKPKKIPAKIPAIIRAARIPKIKIAIIIKNKINIPLKCFAIADGLKYKLLEELPEYLERKLNLK